MLSNAITMSKLEAGPIRIELTWPFRILLVTTVMFLLPALSLGTVSPVVAKLAVDRLERYKRTGTAIGQVYAWGMVGSILGTFLTGFVLINYVGTKGVILLLGTTMAFGATILGSVWHAIWAGIPLGLCVIAFVPFPWFQKIGLEWGIREQTGDPDDKNAEYAWIDESNYYFIKINNDSEDLGDVPVVKRTLVLDNLIHGYFILDHPERLDYDYEHIYALVAYRAAKASGRVTFKTAEPGTKPAGPVNKPSPPEGARRPRKTRRMPTARAVITSLPQSQRRSPTTPRVAPRNRLTPRRTERTVRRPAPRASRAWPQRKTTTRSRPGRPRPSRFPRTAGRG